MTLITLNEAGFLQMQAQQSLAVLEIPQANKRHEPRLLFLPSISHNECNSPDLHCWAPYTSQGEVVQDFFSLLFIYLTYYLDQNGASWKGPSMITQANCLTDSGLDKLKYIIKGIIQMPLKC